MIIKQWLCTCGEWVSTDLPEHRHVFFPSVLGRPALVCDFTELPIINMWVFRRTKHSATRELEINV